MHFNVCTICAHSDFHGLDIQVYIAVIDTLVTNEATLNRFVCIVSCN